ncbi:hypothetical protein ACJRO7_000812 [Eucalyptus globulus]|uniref:Zinc finger PHD-type domain-containing protein n=1 Tax=Eucalyptus globulus TaxID=34317 RepID=A0ABD3LPU9_EUCGL
MASSGDEAGKEETVLTYFFKDLDDELVSFAVLPETVFLHRTADNGLRKIYREVKSWRFDLGRLRLSKDNIWFKLDKPRRRFRDTIRTVLITLHCLHYARNHSDASREALWEHLAITWVSFYEVRPSAMDLQDHMALIKEAMRRDDALAKSKVLSKFMEEKTRDKSKAGEHVAKPIFIADDAKDVGMVDVEDKTAEVDDCFNSVCALCDDVCYQYSCDGKCMRSFHATEEDGEDSLRFSWIFTAMQTFKCENCRDTLHQCFACGKLGSSDKSSSADVFQCISATCGHFYHPHCVAKLLHRRDEVAAEKLKLRIASGESFTCPVHKCCTCNQIENEKEYDLQFAVCRRCPKSYHRKWKLFFEDSDEDATIRAWEGFLPNRKLIYCCRKHMIDEEIGTPLQNQVKFPIIRANKAAIGEKRKRPVSESLYTRGKDLKKNSVVLEDSSKRASEKQSLGKENSPFTKKEGEIDKKVKVSSRQAIAKKIKVTYASKKFHKDIAKSRSLEPYTSFTMREHTYLSVKRGAVQPSSRRPNDSLPALDADIERRLLDLKKEATSSISMGDVMRKQKVPSTHAQDLKSTVDGVITIGKVEGAVQVHTNNALIQIVNKYTLIEKLHVQRLEEGDNNEDA